ncbi:MAG: CbtA family protein [Pseudonocardiaceae bacterium]
MIPRTPLWDFRIASLGTQLVMWATIGVVFGTLVARHLTHGLVSPRTGPRS